MEETGMGGGGWVGKYEGIGQGGYLSRKNGGGRLGQSGPFRYGRPRRIEFHQ